MIYKLFFFDEIMLFVQVNNASVSTLLQYVVEVWVILYFCR